MNIITIDCGASFIKGALIKDGLIYKKSQKKAPIVHGQESVYEIIQITNIISLVEEVIQELIDGEGISDIGLCISNEMHGFILAKADGTPITDYISWQKEYGNIEINNLSSANFLLNSPDIATRIKQTGMPIRAGLPSCNLCYLIRAELMKDDLDNIYFYTLGDYILKIISKQEPQIHLTNAAATGLYNLLEQRWDGVLIDKIGASAIRFPMVGNEAIVFRYKDLNVKAYPSIGDQQAALLGANVENSTDISFNLGTGAQVSKIIGDIELSDNYQTRPYFEGKYIKTIPHIPSGRALNVYFRFVKDILEQFQVDKNDTEIWGKILEGAGNIDDTEIQTDLSFFENAITQYTTGSIVNIRENNFTFAALMKSVFKQMASNFIMMSERLNKNTIKVNRLIFSGGISRRINCITREIAQYYPNAEVIVAEDETLWGLFKYYELSNFQ